MKYVVFLNGKYPEFTEEYKKELDKRVLYCADGGANKAYELGLIPKEIVGDLDSISKEALKYFKNKGVKISQSLPDKDYTDFELVLMSICNLTNVDLKNRFLNAKEPDFYKNKDILVFGATGGRVDMTICNLRVLMHNKNMKYITETNDLIYYIDSKEYIYNMKNKRFGIIPLTDIKELTLKGFMYNLDKKNIDYTKALVSNVITENTAYIDFKEGKALINITLKN